MCMDMNVLFDMFTCMLARWLDDDWVLNGKMLLFVRWWDNCVC